MHHQTILNPYVPKTHQNPSSGHLNSDVVHSVAMGMGDIRITIPDGLHRELKSKAAKLGKILRNYVIELLEEGVKD